MGSPILGMRPKGSGSIRRVTRQGVAAYEACAPGDRWSKGEFLGIFETRRGAERAIAGWMQRQAAPAREAV